MSCGYHKDGGDTIRVLISVIITTLGTKSVGVSSFFHTRVHTHWTHDLTFPLQTARTTVGENGPRENDRDRLMSVPHSLMAASWHSVLQEGGDHMGGHMASTGFSEICNRQHR